MSNLGAARIARCFWENRRTEMILWMVKKRGFTRKGAEQAARSFIDTQVFVALETGECPHEIWERGG